jgi:hypothetical protein
VSARTVRDLLEQCPRVWSDLGTALVPLRASEPPDSSPDPRNRPTPARLDVLEHRVLLLRGLRWWVDAVMDPDEARRLPAGTSESPARLCALLLHHLGVMSPEDREQLREQLATWLWDAYPFMGKPEPVAKPLPADAMDRLVPLGVAAKVLGLSLSTIRRRANGANTVRMRDVAGDRRTREHSSRTDLERSEAAEAAAHARWRKAKRAAGDWCDRCDSPAHGCAH